MYYPQDPQGPQDSEVPGIPGNILLPHRLRLQEGPPPPLVTRHRFYDMTDLLSFLKLRADIGYLIRVYVIDCGKATNCMFFFYSYG